MYTIMPAPESSDSKAVPIVVIDRLEQLQGIDCKSMQKIIFMHFQ